MNLSEITLPELSGGLNTKDPDYLIADNQSPDLLNVWWKDKVLAKRPGQVLITALADVKAVSNVYNGCRAVHAGTSLYKWDGTTATEKKTGVEKSGNFFELNGLLYFIDGKEIWEISSTFTVTAITPYKPVVMINARPDLSESETDSAESYNLIGAGFTVHYNGDGETTTYQLPQKGLDATEVQISVDATDLKENEGFTVNRTNGTVDFSAGTSPHGAPSLGTNNVWITAFKTITGNKAKIAKCTIGIPYGGEQSLMGGTRCIVMGNPDYPFTYWYSDLVTGHGMAYFPDTNFEHIAQNNEPITAAAKMGGELIIFKQHSIFALSYATDGFDSFYPVRQCHSAIGCDIPKSVQLIDNRLVFGNTQTGMHILIGTSNQFETNVKPLSANINELLFREANLENAVSIDYGQYYFLCVNGRAYLWDYGTAPFYSYSDYDKAQRRLAWYRWDNINATCFFSDTDLYYGSANGVVKFIPAKNDFNSAITAYFKTKAFDLGAPHILKTFTHVYPSFASDANIATTISVENEDDIEYRSKSYDIKSFNWATFNWSVFTWNGIKYSQPKAFRLKMKKKKFIQLKAESTELNRGLGLVGLRISYFPLRKIKR